MTEGSNFNSQNQYSATMSINLMGGESYVLVNNVQEYYKRLESLLEDIKKDKLSNYLYFAFIALASATLEFSLNFMLAVFCFEKFRYPEYNRYLRIYEKISFREKLFLLPQIIYEGKCVMNEDNSTIKILYELIKLRNDLLHNTENVQTFEFPDLEARIVDNNLCIPWDNTDNGIVTFDFEVKDSTIATLSKEQCIKIAESLLTFRELLMTPFLRHDSYDNNKLLIKLEV